MATKPPTNGNPPPMSRLDLRRKTSLVAGAFYLITFVSIPTLALYAGVRDPNFIVGAGPDSGVLFGGILELIVALAGIGTAIALWEFSLGLWLVVKGFRPSPILFTDTRDGAVNRSVIPGAADR